jgi:type IV pilus assembly protein PilA
MDKMLKIFKKRLKNQRGLTLVELLAVIVILGIIAAIAVPSIGGIIEKSKKDAAVADALQIIGAAKIAHTSNPEQESWDHSGSTANTTYLKDFLSHVEDDDYTVTYTNNTYSIADHEAALEVYNEGKTGDAVKSSLTEKDLIDLTK